MTVKKSLLLIALLPLPSCETLQDPTGNSDLRWDRRDVTIETSYLGFRPSYAKTVSTGKEKYELRAVEAQLVAFQPQVKAHMETASTYFSLSRKSFWIGFGGLILSQICESQNFVQGRTAGNAIWGVGWTMWLGFLGLTQAEYNDAAQDLNSKAEPGEGPHIHSSTSLPKSSGIGGSGTVFSWTFVKF